MTGNNLYDRIISPMTGNNLYDRIISPMTGYSLTSVNYLLPISFYNCNAIFTASRTFLYLPNPFYSFSTMKYGNRWKSTGTRIWRQTSATFILQCIIGRANSNIRAVLDGHYLNWDKLSIRTVIYGTFAESLNKVLKWYNAKYFRHEQEKTTLGSLGRASEIGLLSGRISR